MCRASLKKTITLALVAAVAVALLVGLALAWWNFAGRRMRDVPKASPPIPRKETGGEQKRPPSGAPLTASVTKGLEVPWSLDFLPDGSLVFTERRGRVQLVDTKNGLLAEPLLTVEGVATVGEGGLLGLAVHPDFSKNGFLYLYHTYQTQGKLANRVVRYRMERRALTNRKVIIAAIPGAAIHNGGRIKFGPDGYLYITAGDAAQPELAQDKSSLAGKILRLTDEGRVPPANPFPDSPVYSLGHRNPQGLAWDEEGRLWETEHGQSATDEVNLIEPGKNYGWPLLRGSQKAAGFQSPMIQSGQDTWAPSGAAFLNSSLFFAGLRGQSLFELRIEDNQSVRLLRHLQGKLGRLRDVVVGPDGFLYILTNNRDGRGLPTAEDDQIIRVNPERL